jgi:hypothetical protein
MGAKVAELHHGQLPAGQQQFRWMWGICPKGCISAGCRRGRKSLHRKSLRFNNSNNLKTGNHEKINPNRNFYAVGLCLKMMAGNVSMKQAEKVAMNFYFERHNMFQGEITLDQIAIQSVHTEKDAQQTYYYVFHFNPAGFVIVPADDCLFRCWVILLNTTMWPKTSRPMCSGGFGNTRTRLVLPAKMPCNPNCKSQSNGITTWRGFQVSA